MHRHILRYGCLFFSALFFAFQGLSLAASAQAVMTDLSLPNVSAQSAILLEPSTDIVIYEKNANTRLPMASTTKIMTAIVALEHADPSSTITVSPMAVGIEGSSVYLYAGEQLSLEHLLYALLLESANDAAAAIAIAIAGSIDAFADLMNQKAAELGLTNTHFTNPHGLDHENHYTTAADLARIAAYCMENELFRTIVSTQRMSIPMHDTEGARLLLNHNRLLRSYEGTIGLKTGYTKRSGRCLVSAVERNGMTLICVTLNAPDDWDDHRNLFEYGFSLYTSVLLQAAGTFSYSLPVIGVRSSSVNLTNANEVRVIIPEQHGEISLTCEAPRWISGNIAKDQQIGQLIWKCDGEIIACEPLVATASVQTDVPKINFFRRLFHFFIKH